MSQRLHGIVSVDSIALAFGTVPLLSGNLALSAGAARAVEAVLESMSFGFSDRFVLF